MGKVYELFYNIVKGLNIKYNNSKVIKSLELFDTGKTKKELGQRYLAEKLALTVMVLILGIVVLFIVEREKKRTIVNEYKIDRPTDKKEEIYPLEVEVEKYNIPVDILVKEQRKTGSELQRMLTEVKRQAEEKMLGDNANLYTIDKDLTLIKEIKEYPSVQMKWKSSNEFILSNKGEINFEHMEKVYSEGGNNTAVKEEVQLKLEIKYFDEVYETEYSLLIQPPLLSEKEYLRKKIIDEIDKSLQNSQNEAKAQLPSSVSGLELRYGKKEKSKGALFLIVCLVATAIFFLKDIDLDNKTKIRKEQMLIDYSDIVIKLNLLVGAGLTTVAAIKRIAGEYERGKKKRYLYEELVLACKNINNGRSEVLVLEQLANRIEIQEITRLSNILIQNIRLGTREMSIVLEEMSREALESKKALAVTAGEKAGTKLLIPMMISLLVVMIIIIVPVLSTIKL